jgi:hypothetical protein
LKEEQANTYETSDGTTISTDWTASDALVESLGADRSSDEYKQFGIDLIDGQRSTIDSAMIESDKRNSHIIMMDITINVDEGKDIHMAVVAKRKKSYPQWHEQFIEMMLFREWPDYMKTLTAQ